MGIPAFSSSETKKPVRGGENDEVSQAPHLIRQVLEKKKTCTQKLTKHSLHLVTATQFVDKLSLKGTDLCI